MTSHAAGPADAAPAGPVIVGAGLAGLVTALRLAPLPCTVLSAGALGDGAASAWAQGGIAAAVGADDSPARHAADTLAAGAGLCDRVVVERVTQEATQAVDWLAGLGARFDRGPDGGYRLGLEGAHSRRRIVHAAGDGTGAEVLRAVVATVRATPSITVLEHTRARRVLVRDGGVRGVVVEVGAHRATVARELATDRVVLATGGSGALWAHTTNPRGARGQGLALAARAGAELRDLEMVQFHPTALDAGVDPMPLVSEALRGAGALLVDGGGTPLTDDPLAPRDVVSRLVWDHLRRGGRVYLDARGALGTSVATRFPSVTQACRAAGVDPASDLVPVRPAAHYHCGGVTVDLRGRTTVPGLWAVGEVASSGLHGANRLASNSLLEAVVCARWCAEDLASLPTGDAARPRPGTRLDRDLGRGSDGVAGAPAHRPGAEPDDPSLRDLMSRTLGLLREGTELDALRTTLRAVVGADPEHADDATLVALLVTDCAARRRESRGGHARLDHPRPAQVAVHTTTTLARALAGADVPTHPGSRTGRPRPAPAGGRR